MKIEHIALWCNDIEAMKTFYIRYFAMKSSEVYHNPVKRFTSYFLSFPDGGARIELMYRPDVQPCPDTSAPIFGYAHLSFSVGGREVVDALTELLRHDGYAVVGEPRVTGDGYYESVVLDPEGNQVEITE